MRVYRERLVVPGWWWLTSAACVVLLGTTVWAGFSLLFGVIVYAVLEVACVLIMLSWGSTRIEVTDTELLVGSSLRGTQRRRGGLARRSRRLPLSRISEVAALDAAQTTALRGPHADPAAYLLVRPYLPMAVYVAIAGRPAGEPYLLLGTRRPAELASAIERARSARAAEPAWDDAAEGHALQAGSPER
jgi:hypothetical protein